MNWMDGVRRGLVALIPAALALHGCVLLVGGAAVGGAVVGTDRRSAGIQLEDRRIQSRIESALNDRIPKHAMNIEVVSYDRRVLLAGEVRTAEYKEQATDAAKRVENVREVFNELTVSEPASWSDRTDDTYVEGKVKTALLGADGVPTGVVMTTVNNGGVCYLMGKVTPAEGEAAATAASRVGGVRRVVKFFELIDAREAAEIRKEREVPPPNTVKDDASTASGH